MHGWWRDRTAFEDHRRKDRGVTAAEHPERYSILKEVSVLKIVVNTQNGSNHLLARLHTDDRLESLLCEVQ